METIQGVIRFIISFRSHLGSVELSFDSIRTTHFLHRFRARTRWCLTFAWFGTFAFLGSTVGVSMCNGLHADNDVTAERWKQNNVQRCTKGRAQWDTTMFRNMS